KVFRIGHEWSRSHRPRRPCGDSGTKFRHSIATLKIAVEIYITRREFWLSPWDPRPNYASPIVANKNTTRTSIPIAARDIPPMLAPSARRPPAGTTKICWHARKGQLQIWPRSRVSPKRGWHESTFRTSLACQVRNQRRYLL